MQALGVVKKCVVPSLSASGSQGRDSVGIFQQNSASVQAWLDFALPAVPSRKHGDLADVPA